MSDYKCPVCKQEFYPYNEHRGCANKFSKEQYLEALDSLWDDYKSLLGEHLAAGEYD